MVLIATMNDGRFVPVKGDPRDPSSLVFLDLERAGDNHSDDDEDEDEDEDEDDGKDNDKDGGDGDDKKNDPEEGETLGPYDPATGTMRFNMHDLDHIDEDQMKADALKVTSGGPVTPKQIGHAAAVAAIRSSVDGSTSHDRTIATAVRNAASLFAQKQAKGEVTAAGGDGGDVQAAINVAATAIAGIELRYDEGDFDGLTMGMFDLAAKFIGLTT